MVLQKQWPFNGDRKMSNEDLQIRYNTLMVYVQRMRKYQMEYEVFKVSQSKNNYLRYRSKIDKWIADEAKRVNSKQEELFK